MKIVTGYTGEPHITSGDDQARNQGMFGGGSCVLDVGNKFNASLTDATTVTLQDGDGMLQGVHFRIEPGTTEAVSISPGTTGYNRIDLICARYTKDAGTGIEDVNLVVIEGTPSASTPSVPSYTEGDILAGDTLAEFPLYKVTLSGLAPTLASLTTPTFQNYTETFDLTAHSSYGDGESTHRSLQAGMYVVSTSYKTANGGYEHVVGSLYMKKTGENAILIGRDSKPVDGANGQGNICAIVSSDSPFDVYTELVITGGSGFGPECTVITQILRVKIGSD